MRQSAEGGYAYAQNDLGADYALGRGVMPNQVLAAKWFRKAAEQGDPLGEYSLGRMYSQGTGVPKDIPEAVKWYRKAAEQNESDAAEGLGDIYFFGAESIKVDYPRPSNGIKSVLNKPMPPVLTGLDSSMNGDWALPKIQAWPPHIFAKQPTMDMCARIQI